MMKRVGVILSTCLSLCVATACSPTPEPTPAPVVVAKPAPAPPPAPVAVPLEDRPVLGKTGDTTCATRSDDELPLGINNLACLSLLKSTIKVDTAAESKDLKLARVRAALLQPGPVIDGEVAGWVLFATRTHCPTHEINVMGNVIYSPEGVEISRATPFGGRLALPEGIAMKTLFKEVCG